MLGHQHALARQRLYVQREDEIVDLETNLVVRVEVEDAILVEQHDESMVPVIVALQESQVGLAAAVAPPGQPGIAGSPRLASASPGAADGALSPANR